MTNIEDFNLDLFPPYAIAFYEVAIDEEARLAVRSFLDFGEAITVGHNAVEAAGFLHEALNHCAAISRFFWPPVQAGKLAAHRAAVLRKTYAINDSSSLNNRKLRNSLEHFDERIDQWIAANPVGPIIASPVLASHAIINDGFGHAFKVIDTDHDIYVVLGEKFEFGSLAREVSNLFMKSDEIEEPST